MRAWDALWEPWLRLWGDWTVSAFSGLLAATRPPAVERKKP